MKTWFIYEYIKTCNHEMNGLSLCPTINFWVMWMKDTCWIVLIFVSIVIILEVSTIDVITIDLCIERLTIPSKNSSHLKSPHIRRCKTSRVPNKWRLPCSIDLLNKLIPNRFSTNHLQVESEVLVYFSIKVRIESTLDESLLCSLWCESILTIL